MRADQGGSWPGGAATTTCDASGSAIITYAPREAVGVGWGRVGSHIELFTQDTQHGHGLRLARLLLLAQGVNATVASSRPTPSLLRHHHQEPQEPKTTTSSGAGAAASRGGGGRIAAGDEFAEAVGDDLKDDAGSEAPSSPPPPAKSPSASIPLLFEPRCALGFFSSTVASLAAAEVFAPTGPCCGFHNLPAGLQERLRPECSF